MSIKNSIFENKFLKPFKKLVLKTNIYKVIFLFLFFVGLENVNYSTFECKGRLKEICTYNCLLKLNSIEKHEKSE